MPALPKSSTQKPAKSPGPDRKERVVTASNGQRMRSSLAQMQKARSVPLMSPAAPASAGAPPEGGTVALVEPSEKDRRLKVVADTIRLSPEGYTDRRADQWTGQLPGDPDRTMDGRKLMMAVDAALRAGATLQEAWTRPRSRHPPRPSRCRPKWKPRPMRSCIAIGQIGGPIAITREQVVSLINARGIEAADKTMAGIPDTIKRNNEAASASARAPKPPTPATPVDMVAHGGHQPG